MKQKYTDWIAKNYPTVWESKNQCNAAVRKMAMAFHSLSVQVGYANGVYHCWCKDSEGGIVDPTAKQFMGDIKYTLIAERFLKKHEIELSTGAIFLDT